MFMKIIDLKFAQKKERFWLKKNHNYKYINLIIDLR